MHIIKHKRKSPSIKPEGVLFVIFQSLYKKKVQYVFLYNDDIVVYLQKTEY